MAGIGIVLTGCVLAACGTGGGGAAKPTPESPSPVADAGPARSADEPAGQTDGELGPTGLGGLGLGMSVAEARDTGLLGEEANGDTGNCRAYLLEDSADQGNGVLTALWFSPSDGLGVITTISDTLPTAEGVAKGMSEDDAREIYPDLGTTGAVISTGVPGNDPAIYSFTTIDGTIASVTLGQRSNECFQAWFETQQPEGGTDALGSVLGPDGLGALELGMGYEDAARRGLVTSQVDAWSECAMFKLANGAGTATFLLNGGVYDITVFASTMRTPEDAGVGSTVEELQQAYPDGYGEADGFTTRVPGGGETYYAFETPEQGTASGLTLVRPDDGCQP